MSSYTPRIHMFFYSNPDGYPPVVNSIRLLATEGYQQDVFSIGESRGVSYPSSVCLHRLSPKERGTWPDYASFLIRNLLQSHRHADLFVGHDLHGFLIARLLSARLHRPLIYHCHDFTERGAGLALGGRSVKSFEERYARTAECVIVPDAERAQVMAAALRLTRSPMIVANAPLARAEPTTRLQDSLAERGLNFSRIVLRQGRIGPGHAIESTVRSLPLWQDPNWVFVVMGLADADYNGHLQDLARRQGVADRFVILPPVSYDEVSSFTTGASLGHALYEPLHVNNRYITTASNKTMEYMAAGIPVLVSDRPGLRALVERYDCGLTADESDPAGIAAAVNTLLGNPLRARQMGANAARAFDEEFRYEKQFAPVLTAMSKLVSARQR